MTRANGRTLVAFGCALAMMSMPTPGAHASGRLSIHLDQYGQSTVRDLPRATPTAARSARCLSSDEYSRDDLLIRRHRRERQWRERPVECGAGQAEIATLR